VTGPPASPKLVSSLAVAQQRWKAVEKRLREALRRGADWPLLHEIDSVVGAYAEASKEERGASEGLEMQMDDGFHRLMLHGVCQVRLRRFQGEVLGNWRVSSAFLVALPGCPTKSRGWHPWAS
jgi:hypothetical protein